MKANMKKWVEVIICGCWFLFLATVGVWAEETVTLELNQPAAVETGKTVTVQFQAPETNAYRLALSGGSAVIQEGNTYSIGYFDDKWGLGILCDAGEIFQVKIRVSGAGTDIATLKMEPFPSADQEYNMFGNSIGCFFRHGEPGGTYPSLRIFRPAKSGFYKVVRANMDITVHDNIWTTLGVMGWEGEIVKSKSPTKSTNSCWNDELFVALEAGKTYFIFSRVTGYYERDQKILGAETSIRVENIPRLEEGKRQTLDVYGATDVMFTFTPGENASYQWQIVDETGTSSYGSGTGIQTLLEKDINKLMSMQGTKSTETLSCRKGTTYSLRVYVRSAKTLSVKIQKITASKKIAKGTAFTVNGIRYMVTKAGTVGKKDGEVKVTGSAAGKSTLTIPASVAYKKATFMVTSIQKNAFKGTKNLKSVTIGKNIASIGSGAFRDCSRLQKIVIQSTKLTGEKVGGKAFYNTAPGAAVTVPKNRQSAYKKWLFKKGISEKGSIKGKTS